MDMNFSWPLAILCVAAINTFNYYRLSYKAKVFKYFGRKALSMSGLSYLTLMAIVPAVCALALLSFPFEIIQSGLDVPEVAMLTASAWISNHAMSWLSLGVVAATDRS